ncbi:MAG: RsmE family RNA methyltransferase [Bacilli bacterium]|nr:RsmE family RNA methyltransferase [Bacilli bacterium]
MQQYFVNELKENLFLINKDDYHHILSVMRFKSGDNVVVVYQHTKFLCSLVIEKDFVGAQIIEQINENSQQFPEITLIYGLPKLEKFELVLQKACEIGVKRIVPFLSKRSIIKLDNEKIDKKIIRWEKILKEASEQSRRNDIPIITNPISIKELNKYLGEISLVADERKYVEGVHSFYEQIKDIANVKSVSIIIGPEGGFDESEFKYFDSLNVKPISLGKRILRSETACIYALSIIEFFKEKDL